MYLLKKDNGELIKDYGEILNEQYKFYDNLYTRNNNVSFCINDIPGNKLDINDKLAFEMEVSKDELFDAVMTLKTGKTQGIDGLGVEFYRKFWKDLIDPLHDMYLYALEVGYLNPTARRGIINLIPKKKNSLMLKTLATDCTFDI